MKYGKRHTMKKVMRSPFVLVAVLIAFIFLARGAWNIHEKASISRLRLEQAQSELAKLQSRQVGLASEIDRLSTEQGVETEIRTKYKGVRPGESVAVIIGDNNTASETQATSTASVGWFRELLRGIGL